MFRQSTNDFKKLPEDILKGPLFESLDSKEIAQTIASTSKYHHALFKSQLDPRRLIHHVAYGEQDQAEALLKKLKDSKDEKALNVLLSRKMDVTDIAGRKFKKITAFQYALWALDRHMWKMLLNYLTPDQAISQLKELEELGVTYDQITGEKHFDFSPLINALQEYIDQVESYDGLSPTSEVFLFRYRSLDHYWCHVGAAQRNMPAHVVHEYCQQDRSFHPTPNFNEPTLSRQLYFINFDYYYACNNWFESLFPLSHGGNNGQTVISLRNVSSKAAVIDLAAITALRDVRTNEFEMLKTELLTRSAKVSRCNIL